VDAARGASPRRSQHLPRRGCIPQPRVAPISMYIGIGATLGNLPPMITQPQCGCSVVSRHLHARSPIAGYIFGSTHVWKRHTRRARPHTVIEGWTWPDPPGALNACLGITAAAYYVLMLASRYKLRPCFRSASRYKLRTCFRFAYLFPILGNSGQMPATCTRIGARHMAQKLQPWIDEVGDDDDSNESG
jgi:hypothetical protein